MAVIGERLWRYIWWVCRVSLIGLRSRLRPYNVAMQIGYITYGATLVFYA